MDRVGHRLLTGSELHEPKGISVAPKGSKYISDGAGSGNWDFSGNDIINCFYEGPAFEYGYFPYRATVRQRMTGTYLRGPLLTQVGTDYVEIVSDNPSLYVHRFYLGAAGLTVEDEKITIDFSVQPTDSVLEPGDEVWFNLNASGALSRYQGNAIMYFNEAG